MIKLNLYVGRRYDGYGEQVVDRETVVLTDLEASFYLQQLVEEKGIEATKNWIKKVKGKDEYLPPNN